VVCVAHYNIHYHAINDHAIILGRENLAKQIQFLPFECQMIMVEKIKESTRLRSGQINQVLKTTATYPPHALLIGNLMCGLHAGDWLLDWTLA
jgi:hypothetical protein